MEKLPASALALVFRAVALLAIVLFYGPAILNGGLKALILSGFRGKFQDGLPLRRNYTGLPLVDYLLSLYVAFFYHSISGRDEAYKLFVFNGWMTLKSAFVWLYVEMARRPGSPKSTWIAMPIFSAILWQTVGGAFSLPLYFSYHILWTTTSPPSRVRDVDLARSIPVAYLLGCLAPTFFTLAPVWHGSGFRAVLTQQAVIAFWLCDPLWVSLLSQGLTKLSVKLQEVMMPPFKVRGKITTAAAPWSTSTATTTTTSLGRSLSSAYFWTRAAYLVAALSSAAAHLYTMYRVFSSADATTNLVRMYVPLQPLAGPTSVESDMVRGCWLYLQYDLAIVSTVPLFWVWLLLTRLPSGNRPWDLSPLSLALLLVATALAIGPGAAVSLALFTRETMLPYAAGGGGLVTVSKNSEKGVERGGGHY